MSEKEKPVCKDCGSEKVWADATATWSEENQKWVLGTVFDYKHCEDCEGETKVEWRDENNNVVTEFKEKKETFEAVQHLSLQNSFGEIKRQNDVKMQVTVGIKDEGYGYFEIYDIETGGESWYAEGGLWFKGKKLTDYDGVFSLPSAVEDKLKEWGYDTNI